MSDSRFDHATLKVEIDGRDAAFQTELNEVAIHFPRLIVNEWEAKAPLVHDKYCKALKLEDVKGGLWIRLKKKLAVYKDAAIKILGLTQLSTGRKAFELKGHRQLHREIMSLRHIKKSVHGIGE